jgi:hypothetical protein
MMQQPSVIPPQINRGKKEEFSLTLNTGENDEKSALYRQPDNGNIEASRQRSPDP